MKPEEYFDSLYFDGMRIVGGYPGGYRDYAYHELVTKRILELKPKSVLELGCSRGYILKRLEDAGIDSFGMDVSKHCWLTRVVETVHTFNLCEVPWTFRECDLCFSLDFWEHIPVEFVPKMVAEMRGVSRRGLHGIDFNNPHAINKMPIEWWQRTMPENHVVVDSATLKQGPIPSDVLMGDGKFKLNIGCYTVMFYHGWVNADILDLFGFARDNQYIYSIMDARSDLPLGESEVDCIYSSHMLEHLSYKEGMRFLRECRRVLKSTGMMRIIVPDANLLIGKYSSGEDFVELGQMNNECASSTTPAAKMYSILCDNHRSVYDWETLQSSLAVAGFVPLRSFFRRCHNTQIRRETIDLFPEISLYVDAFPIIPGQLHEGNN